MLPLFTFTLPCTCSGLVGLAVPMPTLPELSNLNLSVPAVLNDNTLAAGLNMPVLVLPAQLYPGVAAVSVMLLSSCPVLLTLT